MPTTQTDAADWVAQYAGEPEKVREFCVRRGILDDVRTTIELARLSFPSIERLTLSIWKDPLEGTEKAYIFLEVRADFEEAVESDKRFMREWVGAVPFPRADHIGFSYTIV